MRNLGFGHPGPYSKDTTKPHDGHRVLHTGVGQPKFVDTSTAKHSFMLQTVVASRKNHITVRPERPGLKFKAFVRALGALHLGSGDVTLLETNMEAQKGPYKDYSPLKRGIYGFPC